MAFTATEKELYDWARGMLPRWFFESERSEEEMGALVKVFDAVRAQVDEWQSMTFIDEAADLPPDFLDQHARDRGTRRQAGETDARLRLRLQTFDDALTRPVLLAAAQAVLDAESVAGTAVMVELRFARAWLLDWTAWSGTGGTFGGAAPSMTFEPDVAWTARPYRGETTTLLPHEFEFQLVISGAATAANDGTHSIDGLDEGAATYQDADGVAEADATVTWTVQKLDRQGHVVDGFRAAYLGLDQGFRLGGDRPMFVVIVPYDATADVAAEIAERVRVRRAAGCQVIVERRTSP